jgi:hypothetical protein
MSQNKVDEYGHIVDKEGNVIDEDGRVWGKDDSWFRIGLFELICGLDIDSESKSPSFCKYGIGKPGDYCLENLCPHISVCTVPRTLAYTNKYGYVEDSADFDEGIYIEDKEIDEPMEKLLNIWKDTCIKKIDEAYQEYIKDKAKNNL